MEIDHEVLTWHETVPSVSADWFKHVVPYERADCTPTAAIYCYSFSLADVWKRLWKRRFGRRRRRHLLHCIPASHATSCLICTLPITDTAVCCPVCWFGRDVSQPFELFMHAKCWKGQGTRGDFLEAMRLAVEEGEDRDRDCKTCGRALKEV